MIAGPVEFVLNGVVAKKKCCVIHCDVELEEGCLSESNIKNLRKFDKVFSVSKSCSEQLKRVCPELSSVSDCLYNTQLMMK